jgi:hypothetical protein
MKNNLSYYRHEVTSHNHWKFKTLRRKYKWCGEGKFWALNNMIGESDGCKLDISNPDKKAAIAADLDFDDHEFDEYLTFLIEKCRLVIMDEGHLTTPMTQENLAEVSSTRERKRNWKRQNSPSTQEKSPSTELNSPPIGSPVDDKNEKSTVERKVKESKVKESKGKNTAPSPIGSDDIFNEKKNEMPNAKSKSVLRNPFSENFIPHWDEWKVYKKEQHRFSYKPIGEQAAIDRLFELSNGNEETAWLIIKEARANGWKGLFELKQQFNGAKNQREPSGVGKTIEFDRP